MNEIEEFIKWANQNSWDLKEKHSELILCENILNRFKSIPHEYLEFLKKVDSCVSYDETSWLLCEDEYNGNSDIEFSWCEFENISIDAAEGDAELIKEIKDFWNVHLPILMLVKNEYSFYALNINNKSIVYGCEPEFEEVEVIADNFFEFLDLIMRAKINL